VRQTCVDDVRLRCTVISAPKAGSSGAEYEDAAAVPPDDTSAYAGCTLAIADGASESMLAGPWARMLTVAVAALAGCDLDPDVFAGQICDTAEGWPRFLDDYQSRRAREGKPVTWYEEPKLARGAHATLLGVSFSEQPAPRYSGGGCWTAAALGDSCAFLVRDGRLVKAFPVESAADFDTTPNLAASSRPDAGLLRLRTVTAQGAWLPEDVFYLATDAAAKWFLAEDEANRRPWEQIDEAFDVSDTWLEALRSDGRIGNDDTTIVRCELVPV
jgi:hypothetical protein